MGVDPFVIEGQRRLEAARVARGVPAHGNPAGSRAEPGLPAVLAFFRRMAAGADGARRGRRGGDERQASFKDRAGQNDR